MDRHQDSAGDAPGGHLRQGRAAERRRVRRLSGSHDKSTSRCDEFVVHRARREARARTSSSAKFINLYGCEIGDETKIGAFVEIQKNATVGRRCKISSHTFICEGVTIEDHVFVGHGVMFINDSYPRATTPTGDLQTESDWKVERTLVKTGASIGSGATILSNVTIGEHAIVGAGSVVTRDVPARRHRRRQPGTSPAMHQRQSGAAE